MNSHNNTNQNTNQSEKIVTIHVKESTRNKIHVAVTKANEKELGRRIKIDEVLSLALDLLEPKHYQNLQKNSFSNADLFELKFREYKRSNPSATKDEFYGLIMSQK